MKYIITESRLNDVIFKYLDIVLSNVEIISPAKHVDILFVADIRHNQNYGLIGWDEPNILYVEYSFLEKIQNMFGLADHSDTLDVIGKYIENKYNLEVKDVQIDYIFPFSRLTVFKD
jgi:hypothetical protein